jgi:hypothetical protein
LAQAVGDREGAAHARFMLGIVAWHTQEAATARAHQEASRRAFDALGYPSWAARAVMVLGNVGRDEGDDPAAARLYAEAEELARPTGDTYALGFILSSRAYLVHRAGDPRLARRLLEDALALRRARWRCGGRSATRGRSGTRWRRWGGWRWPRGTRPPPGGG